LSRRMGRDRKRWWEVIVPAMTEIKRWRGGLVLASAMILFGAAPGAA
jgi:hypothetical protein